MLQSRIREWTWLLLILLVAGLLRLSYVTYLPGQGRDLLHSDMAAYDESAWKMCQRLPVEGVPGFNGYHPLSASTYYYAGYTYFVAIIYALFGHSPLAVRVIQAVIGTATVAMVYGVGCQSFGRRPACVAATLCAVYLPLVYYAGLLLTETWFIFLQLAALAAWLHAWRCRRRSLVIASIAGLLAGLACITRPVFLLGLPALALGGILSAPHDTPRRRRFMLAGSFLFCAACAIAPVSVRNFQIHGRLILVSTNGPGTFYTGHVTHQLSMEQLGRPAMTDAEFAAWARSESLRYLGEHWPAYLAEIPEFVHAIWLSSDFWPNATTYWYYRHALDSVNRSRVRMVVDEPGGPPVGRLSHFPDLMRYADGLLWLVIGLPLGLLAIFFLPRGQRTWLCVYFTLVPHVVVPFIAWPLARYRIPAVPLVFLLAGQTISVLWEMRRNQMRATTAHSVEARTDAV